jgi:hypothetical protein
VTFYLYAIAARLEDAVELRGVANDIVSAVHVDDLIAIVGEMEIRPTLSAEALASQDRVVRALHDHTSALLPARFGSAFASRDDLARAIATQAAALSDRLTQVRGREQMTLRIFGDAASAPPMSSGAAYLRHRARPQEIAPLLDALTPIVYATIVERSKAKQLIATVYHLIERGTSETYRSTASASTAATHLSWRITGPAPCYAFAAAI